MEPIVAPIARGTRGAVVINLQDGLLLLVRRGDIRLDDVDRAAMQEGLARERGDAAIADATLRTLAIARQQFDVPPADEPAVDEALARALNERLRAAGAFGGAEDSSWIVRGQIVDAGRPVNDAQVSVFDRDLFFGRDLGGAPQLLGQARTRRNDAGQDGWFEIRYTQDQFATGDTADGTGSPDLIFRVAVGNEAVDEFEIVRVADGSTLTEDRRVDREDVILGIQARRIETVRISWRTRPARRSQYEEIWQGIEPLIPGDGRAEPDEAREARVCRACEQLDEARHLDITFIARETGLDADLVTVFAESCRRAEQFRRDVPVSVFFGLATAVRLADVRALGAATVAALDAGIRRAIADAVIPPLEGERITSAVETIRRFAPRLALEQAPVSGSPAGQVLALALENEDERTELLRAARDFTGSREAFWESIRTHPTLGDRAGRIRYVAELGAVTQANVPLIKAMQAAVPEARSVRELALNLDGGAIAAIAANTAIPAPEDVPGDSDEQRRKYVVEATSTLLRNAHPSVAVARVARTMSGGERPSVRVSTARLLERAALRRPDFDLMTTPVQAIAELLDDEPAEREAALGEAARVQRLFRISTSESNFEGLLRSPYQSAWHVTRAMSRRGFVDANKEALAGEAEAELTYRRAMMVSAANLTIAMHAHEVAVGAGPAALAREATAPTNGNGGGAGAGGAGGGAGASGADGTPTWAGTFGSVETCECQGCRSWHSPAAYFVDLLLFLDRDRDPDGKTPLDALLARRPDLAHVKLSCENTNTALPYIDLVNEVLEAFVAGNGVLDAAAAHDVTDESSAQLRARPVHVSSKAYDILADVATLHPPSLPFNRWLEMAREYLRHLGVPRADLLETFAGTYGTDAKERAKARERLAEILGLSSREFEILAGEAFDGSAVAVDVLALYGLSDAADRPRLTQVPELRERLQVSLSELKDLLECRFISSAQALIAELATLYSEFGVDSADVRTFVEAGFVADAGLTTKLTTSGKTATELKTAIESRFSSEHLQRLVVIVADPALDCDPAYFAVVHIDGSAMSDEELRRLHVLVRLWRRIGWPLRDLDAVLMAEGGALNAQTLDHLAQIELLRRDSSGDPREIASLWHALDAAGADSTYARLFLNRAVRSPLDPDFALVPDASDRTVMEISGAAVKVDTKVDAVQAALRLDGAALAAVRADAAADGRIVQSGATVPSADEQRLTIANLSVFHRYAVLARLLELRIDELIALKRLAAIDPFKDPEATLTFAGLVRRVRANGFTVAQLEYLYGKPASERSAAPSADTLQQVRSALAAGLQKIAQDHAEPEEVSADFLQAQLPLVLAPQAAAVAMALIDGRPLPDGPLAPAAIQALREGVVAEYPTSAALAATAAKALFPDPVTLGTGDADETERVARRKAAVQALLPFLRDVLARTLVKQTLIDGLDLDAATLTGLIEDDGSTPALLRQLPAGGAAGTGAAITDFLDAALPSFDRAFGRLHRIALLVRGVQLTLTELRYFVAHRADFDGFDLAGFGDVPFAAGFAAWNRLAAYRTLRDDLTSGPVRLVDVFAAPAPQKIAGLVAATRWSERLIEDALKACAKTAADLTDERLIATLRRVIDRGRLLGVAPTTARNWAVDAPSQAQAYEIVNAAKARYDEAAWLDVAKAINDPQRERQRDALVAYVLRMPPITAAGIRTADGLFDYFLLDTQMSACMLTSRLKQCIASTHLYVQQHILNVAGDLPHWKVDPEEWAWRKNYRVWEANRRVFLYPENWIEPELRDDKTSFFKDLESELLESDVNAASVERALVTYLEKLDAVSRLEVCGFYWQKDGDLDVLHVVGRTTSAVPHEYYYRRLLDGREWTPWEPVTLDIQGVEKDDDNAAAGVHVLPIVWRGTLYLFWPQFVKKKEKSKMVGSTAKASDGIPLEEPSSYWEVRLAWSRYEQGRWSSKRVSADFATWPIIGVLRIGKKGAAPRAPELIDAASLPAGIYLRSRIEGGSLAIDLFRRPTSYRHVGDIRAYTFVFPDPYSAPAFTLSLERLTRPLTIGAGHYQRQHWRQALEVATPELIYDPVRLLDTGIGRYDVAVPMQHDVPAFDSALFYQNHLHSYLAYLYESSESFWGSGMVEGPKHRSFGWTIEKALDPGIGLRALDLPRPPELVVNPSPWQTATVTLLPARIHTAASAVGLAMPVMSAPPSAAVTPMQTMSIGKEVTSLVSALEPTVRDSVVADYLTVHGDTRTATARFHTFFHPHVSTFSARLKRDGVDALLTLDNQRLGESDDTFAKTYAPVSGRVLSPFPRHDVDFRYGGPYSTYNWELFFHIPVLLATRLSQNQRFADAQKWFHYVFDPTDHSSSSPLRFWKTLPLRNVPAERLNELFAKLTPGSTNSPAEQEVVDQLQVLATHPFQPHRLARLRLIAYKKSTFMRYLDNLIVWADQLFMRDTIESINEATELYVRALHLCGTRPSVVPEMGKSEAKTFAELRSLFDEAGNAIVPKENALPFAALMQPTGAGAGVSALLTMGTGLYFCIPPNDKLTAYWDVIADRLFKIRHCMNIEGVVRQLPLFEPPIDPALLVRAAAAGLSVASVMNDLGAPLPRYRFSFMLQKAHGVCDELRSLGTSLMTAMEKKDGEALAALRANHETALLKELETVRQWQIAEAEAAVDALRTSREAAINKLLHYSRLLGETAPAVPAEPALPGRPTQQNRVGMTPLYAPTGRFELTDGGKIMVSGAALGAGVGGMLAGPGGSAAGAAIGAAIGDIEVQSLDSGAKILKYEQEELFQSFLATVFTMAGASTEGLASVLHLIPQAEISLKPLGLGGSVSFGGQQLGTTATVAGKVLGAIGTWHSFQSSLASKLAGFVWREQDHALQRNAAAYEIAQIDRQMVAALIRLQLANAEIENHAKQLERAEAIESHLREKFTGRELYAYLERRVSDLYFRTYQIAYSLAQQAQRCASMELGTPVAVVQFGAWDSLKKGLLAGEQLKLALLQLDRMFLEQNRRELEIVRNVSLLQLDPTALLRLKRTGSCEFTIPEALYDLDYAGHYFRRIRTVGITVPCVVGPHTGLNGTLTLLNSRIRVKPTADAYPERVDEEDPRFVRDHVPVQSIAASTAVNESGLFELRFDDERYLPFEGAGAISRWRFELPPHFRQFDYDTISDVVLHLRYTAKDAGAPLRTAVQKAMNRRLASDEAGLVRMFSLRHEFPNEWHRFRAPAAAGPRTIVLPMPKERFPFFTARGQLTLLRVRLLAPGAPAAASPVKLTFAERPTGSSTTVSMPPTAAVPGEHTGFAHQGSIAIKVRDRHVDEWRIEVPVATQADAEAIDDLVLLCEYKLALPE